MKTRMMKKKFRRVFCASMAAVFLLSDMIPVASAQDTATETLPAGTERIIGFESVNPVEYYELENGGSYQDLKIPQKIRAVVELPEDIQLSTFKEEEPPEQKDELLPKYEYSHTVDKLMLETANETLFSNDASSQVTEDTSSQVTEDASSQVTEDTSSQTEADSEESSIKTVTTEEAQQLLEESSKISYNSAKVYSFTDSTGKTQYRVYGSVNEQDPQWYAVDEEGTVLGVVEELDANWDFSKLDSTVAGKYQVKVQLPENYVLNQDVEIAYMQIMVAQENGEQASSENKDGSLPEVLPVNYILARSAANALANTAAYPVTIEKEGSQTPERSSFDGGTITSTSVPAVENYIFVETHSGDGSVQTNGASLRVTVDGSVMSYNNVTAMYPVELSDGTTVWFYTTTLSDGKVAWQVPQGAELVFRYQPDPNALSAFTKVTIASDDWKDGSATGDYTEGKQEYTAYVPVGERISITVDLPSLYTAYQDNIRYTNIQADQITTTNTRTQLTAEWGPTALNDKWINDTVTFAFIVPELTPEQATVGVRIDLTFLSYMREYYNSETDTNRQRTTENLWLRINQRYPTLSPYPGNSTATAEWKGQRAIRIFERPGTVDFKYTSQFNIQYEVNPGSGYYLTTSKTAYQNLGPEPLTSDMNVATSNWVNTFNYNYSTPNRTVQTYWSTYDNNVDGNAPNSMQTDAYAMQIMDSNQKLSSKAVQANSNDERTLFFVFENTLRNLGPTYDGTWDPMAMSGQDLPIGVMLYTQNHNTGIFVPLETTLSMSDPNAQGGHATMADVEIAGMKIKVTRENYAIQNYNTNMNTIWWDGRGTAKVRNWTYTIQVQGATGYLGADFVTSVDTQSRVSLMSVSPNVESVELLATQSSDPIGSPLVWQTVDSGKSLYVYQLGNNSGGSGQNSSTFGDFYDGVWGTSYSNREGALPIRIKQKNGYGIPYLKFVDSTVTDPKKLIAGISNINIDSNTGTSSITTTQINGPSNRTVRGRIQNLNGVTSSSLDGEVVEYLFGYRENNVWNSWGKVTNFTVEADPKVLVISYDTDGGSATGDITTTTTTWGDGYYITTPTSTPTPPSGRGHFTGWKIKLSDGSFLRDSNNNVIYLQPNQTISTMDQTYFPEDRLAVGHGADYNNSGYFNASVVTLVADYSNAVSEGQMVTGDIHYYTQSNVDVAVANPETSYYTAKSDTSVAPFKQQYYVIRDGDSYMLGGTKYIFNESLSRYSGTADYNNEGQIVLGEFYYDKAITASYNVETNGKPNGVNINAPTDTSEYTTVDGNQNIIGLQSLSGLNDNEEDFQGWMVDGDTVLIPKTVTAVNLDYNSAPERTTIEDTTARLSKAVIETIYNSGQVQFNAVWNTLKPIASARVNDDDLRPDLWNNQYKQPTVDVYYSGANITIEGRFNYDFSTKDQILQHWGGNGQSRNSKAADEMGGYLDWGLYGLEGADGNTKTWSLRGDSYGGAGITTTLTLEETDTDNDGYALATIRVTIPSDLVTYETMSTHQFYFFAWNAESNRLLGTSYDAVPWDEANSPTSVIDRSHPFYDLSGNVVNTAPASEFISYTQMVPRGIKNEAGNITVLDGAEIQWKNIDSASQFFEVAFQYDNTVDWDVQSAVLSNADTTNEKAIRVMVFKRTSTTEGWTPLQRYNPDGTFGNTIDSDYSIELVAPESDSNTFKVKVTANNSDMAASANTYGTQFAVIAYNNSNGEENAPNATQRIQMSAIVGEMRSNSLSTVGQRVPAVQSSVKFFPKGVKIVDTSEETLNTSVSIEKDYWQPSATQTAVFTFDNASYGNWGNDTFQQQFDPEGINYHIGLYKYESNAWRLVESNDILQENRTYIQDISVNGVTGQVTVEYIIPAEENTNNTQYRLMAFYGDIDGNNNIAANTLEDVVADMDTAVNNLATVDITLNPVNVFDKIEMPDSKRPNGVWNDQYKDTTYQYIYTENGQQNIELKAQFKYDVDSKSIIESYWRNREQTPTTDDGMGRYVNWAMYGFNTRTSTSSTWVIREQDVTGDPDSGVGKDMNLQVDLTLNDDGSGEITVTIPYSEVTYEQLSGQLFYLFVWNDATLNFTDTSSKTAATQFKALKHTDTSGGISPYSHMLANRLPNRPYAALGGTNPEARGWGTVPNYYWNIGIVPQKITLTDETAVDNPTGDNPHGEVLDNSQAAHTLTATFKYDNTIPWDVQNVNTANSRYAIRVAVYKQNYNSTRWENVVPVNPDGTFGNWAEHHSASITVNETEGTFTVQINASALGADYNNYGVKYKIVAYNYDNYTGNMSGLLTNGTLNNEIGNTIPSDTTTITFKPRPMASVGHAGSGVTEGEIGHHTFSQGKPEGTAGEIPYHFLMDNASWTNTGNTANAEMQQMFDPSITGGNVIVTLWTRTGGSGNFTLADTYNGGTIGTLTETDDGIKAVRVVDEQGTKKLEVIVQSGTQAQNGTEYRVFAWYVSSNGDGNYTTANMADDGIFDAGDGVPSVNSVIPYSTATLTSHSPDYYIEIPGDVTLFDYDDGAGKIYANGTTDDITGSYAGNDTKITYKSLTEPEVEIPDIQVDITDHEELKDSNNNNQPTGHFVDVYFTDGYRNVTESELNTGMVTLGILSKTSDVDLNSNLGLTGQTMPVKTELEFRLATQKSYARNKSYEAVLTFHFNIVDQSTTTP